MEKLIRQFLQSLPSTSENSGTESEAAYDQSYFESDGNRISDCEKQRAEAKLACNTLTKRLLDNRASVPTPFEMLKHIRHIRVA